MIKDKITPELKQKFKEAIEMTYKDRSEYGFVICKDENENLQPGPLCKGDKCSVIPIEKCSYKKQGMFHTHPFSSLMKPIPREVASLCVKGITRLFCISATTPSHQDLALALTDKCSRHSEGTICIGSDVQMNKISCWTPNITVPIKGAYEKGSPCFRALGDIAEVMGPPRSWIEPLFDVENIDISDKKNKLY
jgi:hypothetical protein